MRLMSKIEYLIVPKGTKFTGSDKLGLNQCRSHSFVVFQLPGLCTCKLNNCSSVWVSGWYNVCNHFVFWKRSVYLNEIIHEHCYVWMNFWLIMMCSTFCTKWPCQTEKVGIHTGAWWKHNHKSRDKRKSLSHILARISMWTHFFCIALHAEPIFAFPP